MFLGIVRKLPKGSQVPFLADAFAAFLAVSGQLSLYADDFFFLSLLVHGFPQATCFKQEPDCTRG